MVRRAPSVRPHMARALSINQSHVAAVHADRIYTWGTECVSPCGREVPGMLGQGIRNTNGRATSLRTTFTKGASSVSCGREHTLLIATDGEVFLGNGEWGTCGNAFTCGSIRCMHRRYTTIYGGEEQSTLI